MHRLVLALVLPLLHTALASAPVLAQEAPDSVPDRWSFSAQLSYTDQTGNQVLRLLTAGLSFSHLEEEQYELEGTVESRYGESDGQAVARNQRATLTYDLHPRERWSPFLFTQAERDELKRLDLRLSGGAGAKYTLYQSREEEDELSFSLALLFSYENFEPVDPVSQQPGRSRGRWSLRTRGARDLRDGVTLRHTTFFQPAVEEMADYLLRSQTGVKVLLTERLALSAEYQWDRDSEPPEGVEPDDRLLKTGLIIEF